MWNFPILPESASTLAPKMNALMAFVFTVTFSISLVVALLIIFFAFRYRAGANVDRSDPPQSNLIMELTWTAIPIGIVLFIFIWSSGLFLYSRKAPANAIEMFVVGKQWMWKLQHPEGQREINALHVPTGQPVKLTMISEDVIHDFAVPAFRIKMDVVPGRYTEEWFEATKPGAYHIFCDQYCGALHAQMIGTVFVMTPMDYETWLARGGQSPAGTSTSNSAAVGSAATEGTAGGGNLAQQGEQLFNKLACATCHKGPGEGLGPTLRGVYGSRVKLDNGKTVIADDAYIRESILNPPAKIVAGYQNIMPTFKGTVSEEDVLQLIAYIKSLKEK